MAFDPRTTSVEALAYLGDCVLELYVRRHLLQSGLTRSIDLNREAQHFVTARSQCAAMETLEPLLTEKERQIFRSGKNPGHLRPPSGVPIETYRVATGMEVLFGRLYLDGRTERLDELFALAYGLTGDKK